MDREEAIYRLRNCAWLGTNKDREETEQAVEMAVEALLNNIDVVRCKNCKHWCNEIEEHTYECCTRAIVNRFKPTDYCSFAERKEE